jgi:predicted nucleotidyltransferase
MTVLISMAANATDRLSEMLADESELALLIGSRAGGSARPDSDWDIAVQWREGLSFMRCMALTERLRKRLAGSLGCSLDAIDLIDIPDARLAMRSVIAEEGIPLKGGETLAWKHFLQRTWRDLPTTASRPWQVGFHLFGTIWKTGMP